MVMRHRLLNVTVDKEPMSPSALGSLLSPASLGIPGVGGGILGGGGGGGGAMGAATAAGSVLAPLVSSLAADIFQAVGADEWEVGEADDDEDDDAMAGLGGGGEEIEGVRPGLYAQRVLSLMKTLHADVPALLEVCVCV